jgi:dGTP triphosphohydrolase
MARLTSKEANKAAYGKKEVIYEKPKLPKKDINSPDYQGMTKKQRNTKSYNSQKDFQLGEMVKTLKGIGKTKEKNASNKEAYLASENPKAKGKNFSKATISNVDKEAYNRVMKRAQDSGLSAKDAKKAIDSAILTVSSNLKTDLSKTAMRAKMQESMKKKKAQNKLSKGY